MITILYRIFESSAATPKNPEDCKIVTSPKQLLNVTRVIYRSLVHKFTDKFSKLHENLQRKDCKAQGIVSFLLRFQGSYS